MDYDRQTSILLLDSLVFPAELFDPILDGDWQYLPTVRDGFERWVDYARGPGRASVIRNLSRQGRYADFMDAEIDARGLPRSLKWIPVLESSYLPSAESRVGAVGLWQLMGPTAAELGLQVGSHVDQRLDPVVSTSAGLEYLATLYGRVDSWLLALAAYNSGPGRVSRLLSQHASEFPLSDASFELISQYLPLETREFVPKFLAYATIARSPGPFGLVLESPDAPLEFDVVRVPDATSLDVIARAAGEPTERVEELNPQILRGYTPFGEATEIRIPVGTAELFRAEYALIAPEDRVSFIEHRIQIGETLSHLANRYGVSLSEIQDANPGVRAKRLQIGQWIIVPRVAGSELVGSPSEPADSTVPSDSR